MKSIQKTENKAFHLEGEPRAGSTQGVSYTPLFVDTRGKEKGNEEKVTWKMHSICLLHGERFHWKNSCSRCRYRIRFQARRVN
jgi:hypothetical protein